MRIFHQSQTCQKWSSCKNNRSSPSNSCNDLSWTILHYLTQLLSKSLLNIHHKRFFEGIIREKFPVISYFIEWKYFLLFVFRFSWSHWKKRFLLQQFDPLPVESSTKPVHALYLCAKHHFHQTFPANLARNCWVHGQLNITKGTAVKLLVPLH